MMRRLPEPGKIGRQATWDCKRGEGGYVLVAVIFMMAILVLSLSVALPRLRQDIQRDHELETLRRGKQYIRAVQLYYRKFHRYPPDASALENTDGVRFLRKNYLDPITGKDDWQPIQFGENKVPMMGLFGKPIVITPTPGAGSGVNSGDSGSTFGKGSSTAASSASNQGSANGQTFGGAAIIGFSIPSEKASILRYKLQDHYRLWEFVYDPTQDLSASAVNSSGQGAGVNAGSTGTFNSSSQNQGTPIQGGQQFGPNGNLPAPSGGPVSTGPWSPNGNLPSPQQ
jgi:type II secretory pathway pseudopilin PulG